jgi:ABC-type bacteriocin/lantibiotic exporter with double-glycine peptidase domain
MRFTLRRAAPATAGTLVLAAVLLLTGCARQHVAPSSIAHLVRGVPFFPQQPNQCGPASLASLLGFFGQNVPPQHIAAEIFDPALGGTSTAAMVAYGARHGFPLWAHQGTLTDIRAELDAGRPVIALHRRAWPHRGFHFVVVTGYEPTAGRLYGYSGRNAQASWTAEAFATRWQPADDWMLVWADRQAGTPHAAPHGEAGNQDQAKTGEGE